MSASPSLDVRPWAVAHRSLLVLATLVVAIAAAVVVPLLVLWGGSTAAPAHAPSVAHSVPLGPAPQPCTIQTVGRPHPC